MTRYTKKKNSRKRGGDRSCCCQKQRTNHIVYAYIIEDTVSLHLKDTVEKDMPGALVATVTILASLVASSSSLVSDGGRCDVSFCEEKSLVWKEEFDEFDET